MPIISASERWRLEEQKLKVLDYTASSRLTWATVRPYLNKDLDPEMAAHVLLKFNGRPHHLSSITSYIHH